MAFSGRSTGVLPSLVTFGLTLQRLNDRINGIAGTFTSLAFKSAQMGLLNQILSPEEKQLPPSRRYPLPSLGSRDLP